LVLELPERLLDGQADHAPHRRASRNRSLPSILPTCVTFNTYMSYFRGDRPDGFATRRAQVPLVLAVVGVVLMFPSIAHAQTAPVIKNVNLRRDPSTSHPPIRL